ncbi:HdeD family acid-resistance protein [Marivita hallyeonensis]|uniref:Uncharacterized membrane protein HdeD, DUF308 family n=1 Tax=Marivita hallyeonensis TaxID=996342 RepID=A0A1M5MZ67_9RHOB|nr:DUF308 domain-containing protein [Marivita hallyeonensis]SHG82053.1 Uncharacterized membrane protein HdeD, DUF308 family [Marivita hallyeonensis]
MALWFGWALGGVLMLIGGIFALLNPFGASLAAVTLAGWAFLLGGGLQLFAVFQSQGWGSRLWALVLAIALLWLGLSLLVHPLAGMITLSFVVAISFIASGIGKAMMAFSLVDRRAFWTFVLSGAISVLFGIYILATFQTSAATILGILLGVDLISTGITFCIFAYYLRDNPALKAQ